MSAHPRPEEIRKNLTHPVVDGDGHWIEYTPVFAEKIRKVTGDIGANGFLQSQRRGPDSLGMTPEQRAERGVAMEAVWSRQSTNTRDRATAMMPRMLYDRLDELGIDFGIVYPTAGIGLWRIADDATRRAVVRGFNIVTHDYFKDLSDRLTPAAVIPVNTPEEAIEELTFVTQQLWAKVCMLGCGLRRPIPHAKGAPVDLAGAMRRASMINSASTATTTTTRFGRNAASSVSRRPSIPAPVPITGERNSPTNFSFNHIGHFAAAGHNVAKALFLGGVTTALPGSCASGSSKSSVGWGCQLFCDLIEHWERRGAKGMQNMDPNKLDRALLRELVCKYGYADIAAELDKRNGWPLEEDFLTGGMPPDDYIHCNITQKQDWIDLYATPYYFGCEADDRMTAVAFGKTMPLGARINAIYSSDIGHWDVVDMRDPLPEAFELVEDGHITEADFRDFVFANAVRLWGTQNPRFFEGTPVAKEAAALLESGASTLCDAAK